METKRSPMQQAPNTTVCSIIGLSKNKFYFAIKHKVLVTLFALWGFAGSAQIVAFAVSVTDNCGGVVCQNGTDIFTATVTGNIGTVSYQWYNGTTNMAISGATSSQFILNSNSTVLNTANATGSASIYCKVTEVYRHTTTTVASAVFKYSVVATNPSPSVSLNTKITCPYDTVHLTPGANTQTPNSTYFVNSTNIVPAVLPATYTVILSNTAVTCNTYDAFTISPSTTDVTCQVTKREPVLTGIVTPQTQPAANANVVINSNITISGNVTLTGNNITIAPGVKITVTTGSSFNLIGCHLHACNCMWYGIEVDGTAAVNVSNGSIIEDAIYAISTDAVVTSTPAITVSNTLFNKNNYGIFIQAKSGNLTNNVNVTNSLFTCRSGFSYTTIQNSAANFQTLLSSFQANWASLSTSATSGQYPLTKTNYGYQSTAGMFISNYSNTSLISIGTSTSNGNNVFDYLYYGILTNKSNITVNGNRFQNMPGAATFNPVTSSNHLTCTGVGVYADNLILPITKANNALITNTITINTNTFYNTLRGADIYN